MRREGGRPGAQAYCHHSHSLSPDCALWRGHLLPPAPARAQHLNKRGTQGTGLSPAPASPTMVGLEDTSSHAE